jgi:hypothetical protein
VARKKTIRKEGISMDKKLSRFQIYAVVVCCMFSLSSRRALAQDEEMVQTNEQITLPLSHDTSQPVRLMPIIPPRENTVLKPLHRRPGPPIVGAGFDEGLQTLQLPKVSTTNVLSFNGINDRDAVAPPDTNASVGQTQVVETVNTSYQVYNKSNGTSLFGPSEISAIFNGLAGPCGSLLNLFSDPVVLYDKAANRWLITILASSTSFRTAVECIAVSTTNDATGSYHRYSFTPASGAVNDYPKFGVWPDAYYASYNIFNNGTTFAGAKVCAYNRTAMLNGGSSPQVCFPRSLDFSLLPSDLDGSTAPPTGTPNFFLELGTSTTLKLFKFHVNFLGGSTFTGPKTLTVNSYTMACGGGACIPQTQTTTKLDSLADRLMFRLAYRRIGTTQESLLASHSVKPSSGPVSSIRWYEIRNPSSTPTVFQQGTFTLTGLATWMPSIGMDHMGNIAVGFSKSSATTHPGIAYTGRVATDPLGTMETAFTVLTGGGSQTGGLTRWGDYSSMAIDPVDDCTFWYATEYIPANGNFNWNTHLNSFHFANCP